MPHWAVSALGAAVHARLCRSLPSRAHRNIAGTKKHGEQCSDRYTADAYHVPRMLDAQAHVKPADEVP